MKLNNYMKLRRIMIEEKIKDLLFCEEEVPVINKSIFYSVFSGGKRIRPILAIMACELFDGNINEIMTLACCIELIHNYSLIHDDLPAMDNDDFRRGKLTNHKVFGEGFAILAGDALLNKAYDIMIKEIMDKVDKQKYIKAAYVISKASGIEGMIGGQAMDLHYEGKRVGQKKIEILHDKKTGALIKASLESGAIIAEAKEKDIEIIKEYGYFIGRAFQISDDILDIKGDEDKLGKPVGKDIINKKSTYVNHYGLDISEEIALDIIEKAKNAISVFGTKAELLMKLADYIVKRDA